MPFIRDELAKRTGREIEFRDEPVRSLWILDGLHASDAHEVTCEFQCSIVIAKPTSDRRLFAETFFADGDSVSLKAVQTHLRESLAGAASASVVAHKTFELVAGKHAKDLVEAMRKSAGAVAFACGVELLPPFHAVVRSRSFEEENRRRMIEERTSSRVADQTDKLRQHAALFRQLTDFRREFPGLSPGHLIEQFAPAEQSKALHSLLFTGSAEASTKPLWAVAGTSLVKIGLAAKHAEPELIPLPSTLGPLRSVRSAEIRGKHVLLVGARAGVFVVDPTDTHAAVAYADPDLHSDYGFNSAAVLTDASLLLACHSEGGLVSWAIGSPDRPVQVRRDIGDGGGPKHLVAVDGQTAALAVGSRVLLVSEGADDVVLKRVTSAPVVSIQPIDGRVVVVHKDGTAYKSRSQMNDTGEPRVFSGDCSAAVLMPFFDVGRLLLACSDGPVECVSLDDALVTRYQSPRRGFGQLAVAGGWLAALTSDRQVLVVWHTWDPAVPVKEIHLSALTRHRVGDIAFEL